MKKSPLPVQNVCGGEKQRCAKEALVKLLRWHFGHPEFRGKQLEAIQAVLSGRDCFCLMPTGGGKSMCYQIPALAKTGIVLVVSPLIALMENQVIALKEKGIPAEFLSSTQTSLVKSKIHEDLDSGQPSTRLLYVTPELIATPGFMSKLTKIHARGLLNLIAIDEAHCISTWGHDFRPSYRKLSSMRTKLPDVPMLALTATAAPKVQKDVIDSLCLQNPLILRSSFNRPNIYYEVRYKDLLNDAYADLCNVLKSSGVVCAIIYCLERTTCDELSTHLSRNGISSAGLNNKLRSSVLDDWLSSKIQVVVATVAFGNSDFLRLSGWYATVLLMGIDRKDVRIVCHFNIPKSMEAFYQESGRAGRDQLPSTSLLYYGIDDRKRMEFILSNAESKKLQSSSTPQDGLTKKTMSDFNQMVEYCEGSGCRRKKILESFGEQAPASLCQKSCDACKYPSLVAQFLEELTAACAAHASNRKAFSQILMSSSKDAVDDSHFSEFWNRDDEASDSEEDISDSDGDTEFENGNISRKLLKTSRLNEKIEFLQRAEENYYRNKAPNKQVNRSEKAAVSEMFRKICKQRLLDALKQAKQRLGDLKIDLDASSSLLENECFKKYGKSGKSFYNSQVASSVRWLSTSTSDEITNRFVTPPASNLTEEETPAVVSNLLNQRLPEETDEEQDGSRKRIQTPIIASPLSRASASTMLPAIPSFSEFVNSRKSIDRQPNASQSPNHVCKRQEENPGKRMKLQ